MFINYKQMYPKFKNIVLYPGQPEILRVISDNNDITQADLANITNREPATITKAIQRLELKGYIRRAVNQKDKRKYHLYVSDKGEFLINQIKSLVEDNLRIFDETLTVEEINILIVILEKLRNKLIEKGVE